VNATTDPLHAAIRRLAFGESLDADASAGAFDVIMRGEATAAQIAALLMALRIKGETAAEVTGAARAMRSAMVHLPADDAADLVDTCGTGGGSVLTFNISTAAALLAAGLGVRVAKHGNRSFTSQSGSADVLESLGIKLDAPLETMERALREAGIVFMFAPAMHPAMRHVGPVRRELAVPTVMNIVGPLANPAMAGRQVVGVAERRRMPLIAGALAALGSRRALVVHGEPGLDEISPLGPTQVMEVAAGEIREWTVDPDALGFTSCTPDELRGGSPAENAAIVLEVLSGRGTPSQRAAVALNAAGALYVAGRAATLEEAVRAARAGLANGVGVDALERLRAAYA
jgi:anthranilate phosphoribosyltransferase